jgi:hypothetical protein
MTLIGFIYTIGRVDKVVLCNISYSNQKVSNLTGKDSEILSAGFSTGTISMQLTWHFIYFLSGST